MQARADPLEPGVARPATVLIREILSQSERFERELGRELGVNPTDMKAMEHLMSDGPLSPGELARRLEISPAAVTTVIDRLASQGHATRAADPDDRRRIVVTPAPGSVRQAFDRIRPMVGDLDAVIEEFPPAQQRAIQRYLERIVERYETHLAGG